MDKAGVNMNIIISLLMTKGLESKTFSDYKIYVKEKGVMISFHKEGIVSLIGDGITRGSVDDIYRYINNRW